MPPKTVIHTFQHYPQLKFAVSQIELDTPTHITPGELQTFRESWFESIEPLLKHIELPERAARLLSAFGGAPVAPPTGYAQVIQLPALRSMTSVNLWKFVEDIADLFPIIIFMQLHQTITNTSGNRPEVKRRNKWIRNRLLKDLQTCETRLTAMRDGVILKIVEGEQYERDQRLLALDHILKHVLQDGAMSVKTLIGGLTS